jgi:cytochrome c oxidase assembly protein subunit 11
MRKKEATLSKKSFRKSLFVLLFAVIAMFAFSFALVPLYNAFCKVTGLNGKAGGQSFAMQSEDKEEKIDVNRTITVQFLVTNNANLPWTIKPNVASIDLHPGEKKHVTYFAQNNSDHEMTIQAIPSISPGQAAAHLKKTQCFCFEHQTLKPGESMDMPIVFHLDTDLPGWINTVSLSYTFFDITHHEETVHSHQPVGYIQP